MNNRWASLVLVVVLVMAIGTAVYWLEDRFGSVVAITGVVAVFCVLCLIIGFQMASSHSRGVLDLLTEFAQRDAMTDRYRQQSMAEGVKGMNLAQRAGLLEQQDQLEQNRWQRKLLASTSSASAAVGEVDPYALPGEQRGMAMRPRVIGQAVDSDGDFVEWE